MTREDFIPLATILLLAPRPLEQNEHTALEQVRRAKAMAARVADEVGVGGHGSAEGRAKAAAELQEAMGKLATLEHEKIAQGRALEDALATIKRLEEELAAAKGDTPSGLHDEDEGGEANPRRVDAPKANPAQAGKGTPTSKPAARG